MSGRGSHATSALRHTCLTPYKRLQVPPYPWGANESDTNFNMFRLRPDEAVLYLGPTPPPCDYFSFTPFLFLRLTNCSLGEG